MSPKNERGHGWLDPYCEVESCHTILGLSAISRKDVDSLEIGTEVCLKQSNNWQDVQNPSFPPLDKKSCRLDQDVEYYYVFLYPHKTQE